MATLGTGGFIFYFLLIKQGGDALREFPSGILSCDGGAPFLCSDNQYLNKFKSKMYDRATRTQYDVPCMVTS